MVERSSRTSAEFESHLALDSPIAERGLQRQQILARWQIAQRQRQP